MELVSKVGSSIETFQDGIESFFVKMNQRAQPIDYSISTRSHLVLVHLCECIDILIRCSLHLLRKEFNPSLYLKLLPFFSYPIPCKLAALFEYCHVELPRSITSDQMSSVMEY